MEQVSVQEKVTEKIYENDVIEALKRGDTGPLAVWKDQQYQEVVKSADESGARRMAIEVNIARIEGAAGMTEKALDDLSRLRTAAYDNIAHLKTTAYVDEERHANELKSFESLVEGVDLLTKQFSN